MVSGVATATQTNPAVAGTVALSMMAASVAGKFEIEARPGWREILALQTLVVADVGTRKSAVHAALTAPLTQVEGELEERSRPERIEAEAYAQTVRRAAEKALNAAGNADPGSNAKLLAEAVSAAHAADQAVVPPPPRLIADDVTPEAAASLLADQSGRMAIFSAEGGVFDTLAGRYSNLPNIDVLLKGHAGDHLRVDRKGRHPEYVKRPALTISLMAQPSVLAEIGANPTFKGRGLLARFLYARPPSTVGRRRPGAPTVPASVVDAYTTRVAGIAHHAYQLAEPVILHLDAEAEKTLLVLEEGLEPRLGEDGDLHEIVGWASKFIGAILRIAAITHIYKLGPTAAANTPITTETLLDAADIGEYYLDQALSVFDEIAATQRVLDARYLLRRLAQHAAKQDPNQPVIVSTRDIQRIAKRFKSADEARPAIATLVDHGYLEPLSDDTPSRGRPASPKYILHPATQAHVDALDGVWSITRPEIAGKSSPSSPSSPSAPQIGGETGMAGNKYEQSQDEQTPSACRLHPTNPMPDDCWTCGQLAAGGTP